ncbi:MAG: LytR family transcriptional attenuator [Frankiales bacterium]|nr:LytR family transcriptional attenuator [Frankiales bacterium]
MTTPRDPRSGGDEPQSNGLPPHLDPRGKKSAPPRVTNAYRQAARGGPAPRKTAQAAAPVLPTTPPGKARRTGGQRVARVLSWIALSMAVVVLVGAGGLYLAFNHYLGQIAHIDVLPKGGSPKKLNKAQNFLLVGSDSRDGS